ncbi:MAG: hypothetical protein ACE5EH_00430 [Gammaproteobacteria bacterium]
MQNSAKQAREAGMKHARSMGQRARASALKRKEEYLGARVPKELRNKVIARADQLGIPVSILIRQVLEKEFYQSAASANDIVTESTETGQKQDEAVRFPGVIGWEDITLNKSMTCTGCQCQIKPGTVVTLGLAGPGEDHVILCSQCKLTG